MVSKTDSRIQPLNLESYSAISRQPSILKNHQKWQISCHLDCETELPVFQLIDPYGLFVTTTEFIVESVDASFRQALLQLKTPEEQQRFICDYLQKQLAQATPYQVHIERCGNRVVVRFGGYGLKGGGRPWEITMAIVSAIVLIRFWWNRDRNSAWGVSWIAAFSGIYFATSQGNVFARLAGTCLASAGISGGIYAYSNEDTSYKAEEFVQQFGYGGLTGLISGGCGMLTQGSELLTTVGSHALGDAAGSGAVAVLESAGETEQEARKKKVINKTIAGALGGGVSAVVGMAIHQVVNVDVQDTVLRWTGRGARWLGLATGGYFVCIATTFIWLQLIKKFAQGGLTAMSSRIVTNLYESRIWNYRLQRSAAIGGVTGAAMGLAEQANALQLMYEQYTLEMLQEVKGVNNELDVLETELNQRIQQGERARQLNKSSMEQDPLVHSVNGIIRKALAAEPVSYVDCDRNELISHVVLVQALNSESGYRYYPNEFNWDEQLKNPDYSTLFTFQKTITPDGIIGHHLDMEKQLYSEGFQNRPQTHWAWNQLVQPHPLGDWEDDKIAVFEPLSEFENSSFKPYAITPYDTQSFMPIHLSERSTIIVPNSMLQQVLDHLTNFKGQVVGYDPSKNLRTVIIDTLSVRYREAWHVCDEEGNLIGHEAHRTGGGYEPKTCLRTPDGQIHILFHNSGKNPSDHHSQAMKEYRIDAKRLIGLHCESTTFWLESKPYFISLREVTEKNIEFLQKCPLFFAANVRELCSLSPDTLSEALQPCVGLIPIDKERRDRFVESINRNSHSYTSGALEAFHFYQTLIGESTAQTGSYIIANYVLREAIFADIMSLFFNECPGENFTLSVPELRLIIDPMFPMLKKLIKQTKSHVDNSADKEASETFNQYRVLLQKGLSDALLAKVETVNAFQRIENAPDLRIEIDFAAAENAWNEVQLPQNTEFDLKSNWPFAPKLEAYIKEITTLLPTGLDQLKQFYYDLRSSYQRLNGADVRREQYRLNILSSLAQYKYQAKLYLKKRNMDDNMAILLDLLTRHELTRHETWLQDHHLQIYDATQRIGDCLFDNIIAQARDISSKTADELRKALVEFMRTNPEEFLNKPDYFKENWLEVAEGGDDYPFTDWDSYLNCLGKSQVWATELEVHALSILLERPIVLVSAKAKKPKIYNPEGCNIPIFLNHKNENHFETCRPVELQPCEIYQKILEEPHY